MAAGRSVRGTLRMPTGHARSAPLRASAGEHVLFGSTFRQTLYRGNRGARPLNATPSLYGQTRRSVCGYAPFPLTRAVLDRGHERFNIYCTPCHGQTGEGNGISCSAASAILRHIRANAFVLSRSATISTS